MKKKTEKKLKIDVTKVRTLTTTDLKDVEGGYPPPPPTDTCRCTCAF